MPSKCKVKCVETGVVYDSMQIAAKAMGLKSHEAICNSCIHPNKTSAGYHWEYYIEPNLPGEVWKDAKCLTNGKLHDFKGKFKCSNKGRIRQVSNGQILSGSLNDGGYIDVDLNGKIHKLHRVIATTFIPNDDPKNKTQVNHIKEDEKSNNAVDNLEWVTAKENSNYGTRTERCTAHCHKKVKCVETGVIYNSYKDAKNAINSKSHKSWSEIVDNPNRTAGGYHWISVNNEE